MIKVEILGSSSKGNCYRLLSGGRSLLLECGLPINDIRNKLRFEMSKLDGCLVSHGHQDHCRAMRDIVGAGIDLYTSQDTLLSDLCVIGHHRAHVIEPVVWESIAGSPWTFMPFEVVHDAPGTMGFVVSDGEGVLVFITDAGYCKYRMPPADVIMIEANFSEAILQRNVDSGAIDPARARRTRENHMSIERVIDFLKENVLSRCREIHLLHLSDGNSDAELFKKMAQEATGIPTFVAGGA